MTKTTFHTIANPKQREAIETTDGPLLIIAGPGSGKTFTLVERVVYLILEEGVTPESLFVATFTDKAAQELRTRVSNRLAEIGVRFNLNEMYLGTFHSICLRWLRDYREYTRLKRNFTLMDRFDQQYFLYQRMRDYTAISGIDHIIGQPRQSNWYKSANLVEWLNKVSEEALDPATLRAAPEEEVRVLGQAYSLYRAQLEEENALDFSTIQYEALKLLRTEPDILQDLQQTITYFMVDEYQDTNTIQEMILTLLTGENPNLCVVGDDDQGLYRFRGATIRNILEFKDKFPPGACAQVTLETNYRSHPDIIGACNRWIADQDWTHNGRAFRYDKKIVPRDETKQFRFTSVPSAVRATGGSDDAWHNEVLHLLKALRHEGQLTDWNQVAFLFRSVKSDRAVRLSRFLERNGIPVYSPRSNQFFDRLEIRLMIGALIFLFPQFPDARKWRKDAHLNIWDYYDNQCFKAFASELRKPEHSDLKDWAVPLALEHRALTSNTDYAFTGLFYRLLQFPLFSQYLDEQRLTSPFRDRRPMYNLALFSQLLNKFEYLHNLILFTPDNVDEQLQNLFNRFFRYLKQGGIDEYEDETEYAPSGCVSFFTIHQSKGLEFPVVFVGSLNIVPRKDYTRLDEVLQTNYLSRPPFEPLECTKYYDFQRLFYTAFSRAQNLLVLTCHEKQGRGRSPSKYFADHVAALPSWRNPDFQVENLPLAQVKEVNLKSEYAFTTHITLFETCAEQYRFFRELEFAPIRTSPILFGTLVHQTIEDIHNAVLRGETDTLSESKITDWFNTNYLYLTKRERVYLASYIRQVALNQVLRYYRRYRGDWSHIRDTEVPVSLVKEDYILKGTIDLIAGQDNTVEVVDFKSEKKPDVNDPQDREKITRYRRQLDVYAHIVAAITDQTVSRSHLYYTSEESGNPFISFDPDRGAMDHTIASFGEIVSRIEAQDFAIAERPDKHCIDCDMRFYCDRKNWEFRSEK